MAEAVCMLSSDVRTLTSRIESNGDFGFEDIDPGTYELVVEGPGHRVVVSDLELGGPHEGA